MLTGLIQGSEVQESLAKTDTSPEGIRGYVERSALHPSHRAMFPEFDAHEFQHRIATAGA